MDPINSRFSKLQALAAAKNAKKAAAADKSAAHKSSVSTPDTLSATTSPALKPSFSPQRALNAPRSSAEPSPPTTPLSEDDETGFRLDRNSFFKSASIVYVAGLPTFED